MLIIFILKAAHIQNNTKYNYDQQSNGKIRRRVNYTKNLKDGGEERVEGRGRSASLRDTWVS